MKTTITTLIAATLISFMVAGPVNAQKKHQAAGIAKQEAFPMSPEFKELKSKVHQIPERFSKRIKQLKQKPNFIYYRTDTVVSYSTMEPTIKEIYTYNSNGWLSSKLRQNLNGEIWEDLDQISYNYDVSGNMLTYLIQYWDGGILYNSDLSTSTYDADGNMLTDLVQYWENGNWQNGSFSTYTYDASGRPLTDLFQVWEGGYWVNLSLVTMTYTEYSETEVDQEWYEGDWVNSYKFVWEDDPAGLWQTNLSQYWDVTDWVNSELQTFTYDANGNNLTNLLQVWDVNTWLNFYKVTYTYNDDGNWLTVLEEGWEEGEWLIYSMITYTYNENGLRQTILFQIWTGTEWENSSRTEYEYTSSNNWLSLTYFMWNGSDWDVYVKIEYEYPWGGKVIADGYTWTGSNWEPYDYYLMVALYGDGMLQYLHTGYEYRAEIAYSTINTDIAKADEKNAGLTVFPNPANDVITIETVLDQPEWGVISLLDLSGRTITVFVEGIIDAGNHTRTYNVNNLNAGLYLLQMKTNSGSYKQKISMIK